MIAMRAWRVGGSRERLPGYLVQFGSAVGISGGGIGDDLTSGSPRRQRQQVRLNLVFTDGRAHASPGPPTAVARIYQELGCCGVGT